MEGPDTNARLWRVDGRRATLIRKGLDFSSLSVDGARIAGATTSGQVLLLNASGRTIRTYAYSNEEGGHVVFVPSATLQQRLH